MSSDSNIPEYGSGIAHGGGAGGSIREAGGAFGVREAVMEAQYFRRVDAQQLDELHSHLTDEIHFLQKQVSDFQEALNSKKERLRRLKELCRKDE